MKKIYLLMLAAVFACGITPARAQMDQGTFSIIPRLGFLSSYMSQMPNLPINDNIELKKTFFPGFLVGADVEYQFTDMFSVAAGLNYTCQGGKWKNYSIPRYELKDIQMVLGYLNLPVVANIYLFDGFALKAGVQLGFLTNANSEFKLITHNPNGTIDSEKFDESIRSDCNKLDFSIPVGLSYEFNDQLIIDARYHLGLIRLNKEIDPDGTPRNRAFVVTVGYRFPL